MSLSAEGSLYSRVEVKLFQGNVSGRIKGNTEEKGTASMHAKSSILLRLSAPSMDVQKSVTLICFLSQYDIGSWQTV